MITKTSASVIVVAVVPLILVVNAFTSQGISDSNQNLQTVSLGPSISPGPSRIPSIDLEALTEIVAKEEDSWKLDTADVRSLSTSPSSRALNVATFVYAHSSPSEIENWRNKHGIKKSNMTQEIHDQSKWLDDHPDVLVSNERLINQFLSERNQATQRQPSANDSTQNDFVAKSPSQSENQPINIYGGASTYTRIGNTTFGSDGSTYTQIGNSVFGNDGSSYQRVGNSVFGNDGSSYQKIGNTTFGSDGSTYQRIGNTIFGSDGSSSTRIGNTTFINP